MLFKNLTVILFFSFIALLNSCTNLLPPTLEKLKEMADIKKLPTSKTYPEDDAVVLLKSKEMYISYQSGFKNKKIFHKATLVFRDLDHYSNVKIMFTEDEYLLDIEARTIRPDGSILNLTKDDFYMTGDVSNSGSFNVSDSKILSFSFPRVTSGCILEFKIETMETSQFSFDNWYVQDYDPILKNQFILHVDKKLLARSKDIGFPLNWNAKPYNLLEEVTPEYRSTGGSWTHTEWTFRDVPAFHSEKRMPPHVNYRSFITFAPQMWNESWDKISKLYHQYLFTEERPVTEKVKNLAMLLTILCKTDMEKIEALFRYTQKLRYVAIELGEGRWSPTDPDKVIETEYGDCKDKSWLLICLLEAVEIKAKPALILTSENGFLDPHFPLPRFNHVITKVELEDSSTLWLDPTISYCTVDFLPSSWEGNPTLVLENDGTSNIEIIPESNYPHNFFHKDVELIIESEKLATYHVKFTCTGRFNTGFRYSFANITKENQKKLVKALILDEYVSAKISDIFFDKVTEISDTFHFGFTLKVNNPIQKIGNIFMLSYNPLDNYDNLSWLNEDERNYPLLFSQRYIESKHVRVKITAEDLEFEALPDPMFKNTEDFGYNIIFIEESKKSLLVEESLFVRSKVIDPKKYKDVKALFVDLRTRQGEKIALKKVQK